MDPHLLIMRKSLVQKRSGKRFACLYACACDVCVYIWLISGQGQRKGTAPHPPTNTLWLSALILPTYQYSADHLCILLSGWNWFGLTVVSMVGSCLFFPHSCWFLESNRSALFFLLFFSLLNYVSLFICGLFPLNQVQSQFFPISSPCGVYRRLTAPGHAGLFHMHCFSLISLASPVSQTDMRGAPPSAPLFLTPAFFSSAFVSNHELFISAQKHLSASSKKKKTLKHFGYEHVFLFLSWRNTRFAHLHFAHSLNSGVRA